MTSDIFLEAMRARPFRSFVLEMTDGRTIRVSHPELIAHKPGATTAIVMRGDAFVMIDLSEVTDLKFRTEEPRTTETGGGT